MYNIRKSYLVIYNPHKILKITGIQKIDLLSKGYLSTLRENDRYQRISLSKIDWDCLLAGGM